MVGLWFVAGEGEALSLMVWLVDDCGEVASFSLTELREKKRPMSALDQASMRWHQMTRCQRHDGSFLSFLIFQSLLPIDLYTCDILRQDCSFLSLTHFAPSFPHNVERGPHHPDVPTAETIRVLWSLHRPDKRPHTTPAPSTSEHLLRV